MGSDLLTDGRNKPAGQIGSDLKEGQTWFVIMQVIMRVDIHFKEYLGRAVAVKDYLLK